MSLERRLRKLEQLVRELLTPKSKPRVIAAKASVRHAIAHASGIPGMSAGKLMTSAECIKYSCDGSGQLTATTDTVEIYNPSSNAIGGSSDIVYTKNDAGLWVVIVESC